MNCTGKHGSQMECEIVGELRSLLQVAFTAIRTQHDTPADWAARTAVALGLREASDPPYQIDRNMSSNLVTRLRDLSNRLRDSGRYTADECDLAAASLIDEAIAALPAETTCSECERLRTVTKTLLTEVSQAEGDYGIGLAMTKAEKAIGWSVMDQSPEKAAAPLCGVAHCFYMVSCMKPAGHDGQHRSETDQAIHLWSDSYAVKTTEPPTVKDSLTVDPRETP